MSYDRLMALRGKLRRSAPRPPAALPRPALELRPEPPPEPAPAPLPLAVPDRHVPGPVRVDIPGPLGLVHGAVPGFRASPVRVPAAGGQWRAVHVDSAHAACMERVSGKRRGPYSDLTSALHRRRLTHRRARLPDRARIIGTARKYRLPVKVVSKMARRIARDIPPRTSREGLREIQGSRGKMSGAARRAARYRADRSIAALRKQPGGTVRAVARQTGESVRAVATAPARLACTLRVDERLWREGRNAARAAVKGWWRKHHRTCADADCTCTDRQHRRPEGLSPDGRPWRYPRHSPPPSNRENRTRESASVRPSGQTDPRTNLSQSEITTPDGASAGAAGLHGAPELQPGEGYRRLLAMRARLRRERRGRWRGPPG